MLPSHGSELDELLDELEGVELLLEEEGAEEEELLDELGDEDDELELLELIARDNERGCLCGGNGNAPPKKGAPQKPTHRGFTENAWIRVSFHPRKSLSSSSSPFLLLSCQFRNSHGRCHHYEVGKMLMYSGALYGDTRRRVSVQSTITNSSIKLGKLRRRYNRFRKTRR